MKLRNERRRKLARFEIIYDLTTGEPYIKRWRLWRGRFFGVMLHQILLPDPDRDRHNHPWPFFAIMLRGGYLEEVSEGYMGTTLEQVDWLSVKPLRKFHSIKHLMRTPTWSLVFTGRYAEDWGFITADGFVPHKPYIEACDPYNEVD